MQHVVPESIAPAEDLEALQTRYPLPPGWSLADTFMESASAADTSLDMVGLIAKGPERRQAMGAAGQPTPDDGGGLSPVARAYFELLERISIEEARAHPEPLQLRALDGAVCGEIAKDVLFPADGQPEILRHSLSNAVALHRNWQNACEAAARELWERDLLLRGFYGQLPPRPIDFGDAVRLPSLRVHYEVSAYEFVADEFVTDAPQACAGGGSAETPLPSQPPLHCAVAVAFPHRATDPLILAFGADDATDSAMASARREFWQRLAFLWGEQLPTQIPKAQPTADFHQEFYLLADHHDALRDWLRGDHRRLDGPVLPRADSEGTVFADLTPAAMGGGLRVARAVNPSALPLLFGVRQRFESFPLPAAMQHHPIA